MEEGGLWELAIAAAAKVVEANGGAPPPQPEGKTYTGVRLQPSGKWSAEIRDSKTSLVWLGSFDTAVEAACAYDAAVRTLRPHRAHARANFPEPPAKTEEEREARAAVVRAHVDEVKRRRAEKEARRDADAAEAAKGDASGGAAEAPEGDASGFQVAPAPAGGASSSETSSAPAVNGSPSAFHVAPSSTTNAPQAHHESLAALRSLAQLQAHRNLLPPLAIDNPPLQPSASQPPLATAATSPAFTRNPQAHRSAFRPYRSDVGSTRQEFPTTGGCTMANIPPAQFQQLYRQFVETSSGLADGGGTEHGTDAGLKAPDQRGTH